MTIGGGPPSSGLGAGVFVFALGAVVLELGSLLSHGAVLAREYGIPAVVNVPGVLEKLEEGQKITVDGTRGVVWLDPR